MLVIILVHVQFEYSILLYDMAVISTDQSYLIKCISLLYWSIGVNQYSQNKGYLPTTSK